MIRFRMAAVGKREENGFAERLMRIAREEEIDLSEYRDFADAYGQLSRFLDDVYNRKRPHSALGLPDPGGVRAATAAGAERRALAMSGERDRQPPVSVHSAVRPNPQIRHCHRPCPYGL